MVDPQVQEITTLALSIPDQAMTIPTIKTTSDYVRAGKILISVKEIRKKIEATFKPIKQKMDTAKREVLDQEKAADAPLKQAEEYLKPLMRAYDDEQERIRKERERLLQEQAQKREEEERLNAALVAEAQGDRDVAQVIIDEEVYVPPIVLPKATQISGISYRENWKARVVSLPDLVRAVAIGKVPLSAIRGNDVFLSQQARAMKSALDYPGVRVLGGKDDRGGKKMIHRGGAGTEVKPQY